jgi:hypothetical protein
MSNPQQITGVSDVPAASPISGNGYMPVDKMKWSGQVPPSQQQQIMAGIQAMGAGGTEIPSAPDALAQKQAAIESKYNPQFSDIENRMKGSQQEMDSSLAAQKKVTPPPEMDFKPILKQMDGMTGLMLVLGALGGRNTMQPMTAALNNMAAVLTGVKEGNDEQIKAQKEQFDANYKQGMDRYKAFVEERNAIYEKHKGDLAGMRDEMNALNRKMGFDEKQAEVYDMHNIDRDKIFAQVEMQKKRLDATAAALEAKKSGISQETIDFYTKMALHGNFQWKVGLGRSAGGSQLITAVEKNMPIEAEKQHVTPEEVGMLMAEFQGVQSEEKAIGTRAGQIEMAANAANSMADIVIQTSDSFPRTQFPKINEALASFESNTGDVGVRKLGAAINSFINGYARAINPTGVATVSDKEHARDMLSKADSQEQLEGIIATLKQEMAAEMAAPTAVREKLRKERSGGSSPAANTSGGTGTATNPIHLD